MCIHNHKSKLAKNKILKINKYIKINNSSNKNFIIIGHKYTKYTRIKCVLSLNYYNFMPCTIKIVSSSLQLEFNYHMYYRVSSRQQFNYAKVHTIFKRCILISWLICINWLRRYFAITIQCICSRSFSHSWFVWKTKRRDISWLFTIGYIWYQVLVTWYTLKFDHSKVFYSTMLLLASVYVLKNSLKIFRFNLYIYNFST